METAFKKLSGTCMMVGCLLLVLTMLLHPAGGNIEHLLRIKKVIIISHSLAILSIPFIGFGFWGLSIALQTASRISMLAFVIALFGLVATMFAAAVNGLVLPFFVSHLAETDYNQEVARMIINYGSQLNKAMDYILMTAFVLAIGIWSALIISNGRHAKWLGYYGMLLITAGLLAAINQYNLIGLYGFRIVVFGIVSWIMATGFTLLLRGKA